MPTMHATGNLCQKITVNICKQKYHGCHEAWRGLMLRFGLLMCVCLFFLGCALLFAFGSAGSPAGSPCFKPSNLQRHKPLQMLIPRLRPPIIQTQDLAFYLLLLHTNAYKCILMTNTTEFKYGSKVPSKSTGTVGVFPCCSSASIVSRSRAKRCWQRRRCLTAT